MCRWLLLHNQTVSHNHFLILELEGTASNRDAVGARVAVTASGRTQVAARSGGGSYLSASDHRLHFGLGPAEFMDRVEVTWPSGRHERMSGSPSTGATACVREIRPSGRSADSRHRRSSRDRATGPHATPDGKIRMAWIGRRVPSTNRLGAGSGPATVLAVSRAIEFF